ncbi:MAG: hypothetical protein Q4G58_15815 [bacterium]|nr:hypothetical protein [bacterium]
MAKYLWVNPVASKMYGEHLPEVEKQLEQLGYILVGCEPQLDYVRNQYVAFAKEADRTILDCRCPESIALLEKHDLTKHFEVPEIEPILVRTSRVLYERYVKEEGDELIITCPCTQLREFTAERLADKKNVSCYSWKEFVELEGMKSLGAIDSSPIPLGFFDSTFDQVLRLSSEEEIVSEVRKVSEADERQYDIVELLYCKDGCNNGNGI